MEAAREEVAALGGLTVPRYTRAPHPKSDSDEAMGREERRTERKEEEERNDQSLGRRSGAGSTERLKRGRGYAGAGLASEQMRLRARSPARGMNDNKKDKKEKAK